MANRTFQSVLTKKSRYLTKTARNLEYIIILNACRKFVKHARIAPDPVKIKYLQEIFAILLSF